MIKQANKIKIKIICKIKVKLKNFIKINKWFLLLQEKLLYHKKKHKDSFNKIFTQKQYL